MDNLLATIFIIYDILLCLSWGAVFETIPTELLGGLRPRPIWERLLLAIILSLTYCNFTDTLPYLYEEAKLPLEQPQIITKEVNLAEPPTESHLDKMLQKMTLWRAIGLSIALLTGYSYIFVFDEHYTYGHVHWLETNLTAKNWTILLLAYANWHLRANEKNVQLAPDFDYVGSVDVQAMSKTLQDLNISIYPKIAALQDINILIYPKIAALPKVDSNFTTIISYLDQLQSINLLIALPLIITMSILVALALGILVRKIKNNKRFILKLTFVSVLLLIAILYGDHYSLIIIKIDIIDFLIDNLKLLKDNYINRLYK